MHGDPYEIRTRVAGVRGRSLRPLDQRAVFWCNINFVPAIRFLSGSGSSGFQQPTRTFRNCAHRERFGAPSVRTLQKLPVEGFAARSPCPRSAFLSGSGSGGFQPPTRTFRNCAHRERFGAPSGTRTRDTLIKSQVLYQLS